MAIRTCMNGHNYDADKYDRCPYCPPSAGENRPFADSGDGGGDSRTQIIGDDYDEKTVPFNEGSTDRTIIEHGTKIRSQDSREIQDRKLVGFLVTYDLSPQGRSFALFEGKNLIGSHPNCDIVISNDPSVSAKHATILYRDYTFMFKDEFSTNGTFIDGRMMSEGVLERPCVIGVGGVRFYFMKVPFELPLC